MLKESISYWFSLLFVLLLAASACDTTIRTDKAEVGEAMALKALADADMVLTVDTAKSEMAWIGAKVTGRHNGIFKIRSGELHLNSDSLLTGGSIEIDMANLQSADKKLDPESNKKLTTHLRSPDFFDVEQHPVSTFEITAVEPYDSTKHAVANMPANANSELRVKSPTHRITGNLTIKGITKSVTFPAQVTLKNGKLKAKANFNIDRTQWNLVYRADKSLGNQTIHSDVNIGFQLVSR